MRSYRSKYRRIKRENQDISARSAHTEAKCAELSDRLSHIGGDREDCQDGAVEIINYAPLNNINFVGVQISLIAPMLTRQQMFSKVDVLNGDIRPDHIAGAMCEEFSAYYRKYLLETIKPIIVDFVGEVRSHLDWPRQEYRTVIRPESGNVCVKSPNHPPCHWNNRSGLR